MIDFKYSSKFFYLSYAKPHTLTFIQVYKSHTNFNYFTSVTKEQQTEEKIKRIKQIN